MIEWLVRKVWGLCIWFARRPLIRSMQRTPLRWLRGARADRYEQSLRRQNLFGLRYGRTIIRVTVWTCWLSILAQAMFWLLADYVANLPTVG